MKALLFSLIDAFLFRVRGGWKIPKTDKRLPLCKLWFAIAFGIEAGIIKGWDWPLVITTIIATFVSYQIYGWGEAVGCLLFGIEPSPTRSDCSLIDDILDTLKINFKGHTVRLTDYPKLWGWLWLTLRGLILTFIIGLALNSVLFMLCGLAMGTVYWLAGQFNKLFDDGKNGWRWAEWFFGGYLGLCLCLFA